MTFALKLERRDLSRNIALYRMKLVERNALPTRKRSRSASRMNAKPNLMRCGPRKKLKERHDWSDFESRRLNEKE